MGDQQFDDLAAVADGSSAGVVARFRGIVAVAAAEDEAPVRHLLSLCAEVAGDAPGRALARRLATWLGSADAPPGGFRFGTLATTGERWAVFLCGAVSLRHGDTTVASGADSAAWADRLVGAVPGPVVLEIDDLPPAAIPPVTSLGALHDLRAGVVGGTAVTLRPASAAVAAPPVAAPPVAPPASTPSAPPVAAPELTSDATEVITPARLTGRAPVPAPVLPPPPPPPADQPPVTRPPRRSERIDGAAAPEPRPPLPPAAGLGSSSRHPAGVASEDRTGPTGNVAVDDIPRARGHLCSRGHLNDPRSHFCVLCGIRMNERTGILVLGERPPLGLLVFDDGATYTVDAEYLVGRMPDVDERVQSGSLRSIVVDDASGSVSRVHAEVRVSGWDVVVVDHGSRNGTHVAPPGVSAWAALASGSAHRLVPGTRVRMGQRTFLFESPSGVR